MQTSWTPPESDTAQRQRHLLVSFTPGAYGSMRLSSIGRRLLWSKFSRFNIALRCEILMINVTHVVPRENRIDAGSGRSNGSERVVVSEACALCYKYARVLLILSPCMRNTGNKNA